MKRMTAEAKAVSKLEATRKGRITLVKARNLNPIVVTGIRRATDVTVIDANDLEQYKIDAAYQRPENREMVNELVAVLEAGGVVPDPITVAVRPDGSRYIVDGQQRWAAHYLAHKPLAAVLYHVKDLDEERRLFSVLNTYRRPGPAVRMRAWTGPSGELLHFLVASINSPVYGEVSFSAGGQSRYAITTLLRGIGAALTATAPRGGTEDFMRSLDRAYTADPKRAIRVAQAYTSLLKALFKSGKIQAATSLALGLACAERWKGGAACAPPSKAALYNLSRMNWTNMVSPLQDKWLPTLKAEILRRWPA